MIEMIVVMVVVALLVSLLLPAVHRVLEASRRTSCVNNLRQIGLAMQQVESNQGGFPDCPNHVIEILPYLDQAPLYQQYDEQRRQGVDVTVNERLFANQVITVYQCPSDPASGRGNNYCANISTGWQKYGNDGFLVHMTQGTMRRVEEVPDGLSNTVMIAEILQSSPSSHRLRTIWEVHPRFLRPDQLEQFADSCEQLPLDPSAFHYNGSNHSRGIPWAMLDVSAYYTHVLPPNRPNCTQGPLVMGSFPAGSFHGGGANALFGDGHVAFISESVDRQAWRDLGSRQQNH